MPEDKHSQTGAVYYSHLFTVRIWHERLGNSESEWRGRVEYLPSREARYFREWSTLVAFLEEVLSQQNLQIESHGDNFSGGEE